MKNYKHRNTIYLDGEDKKVSNIYKDSEEWSLVYLVRSGDKLAYKELYNRYYSTFKFWSYDFIQNNVGVDEGTAKAIFDEAFAKSVDNYNKHKASFSTYLKTNLHFLFVAFIRDENKYRKLEGISLSDDFSLSKVSYQEVFKATDCNSRVVENYNLLEESEELYNNIQKFSPLEREVIRLRARGFSFSEIEKELGISIRKGKYIISKLSRR